MPWLLLSWRHKEYFRFSRRRLGILTTSLQEYHWFHFRICGNFTMDVLAKTGFGIDVNSQKDPDSEFVKNAKKIIEFKMTNPAMFVARKLITVTSCSVANHRQLECLFNSYFRITSMKISKTVLLFCEGIPSVLAFVRSMHGWIPFTKGH